MHAHTYNICPRIHTRTCTNSYTLSHKWAHTNYTLQLQWTCILAGVVAVPPSLVKACCARASDRMPLPQQPPPAWWEELFNSFIFSFLCLVFIEKEQFSKQCILMTVSFPPTLPLAWLECGTSAGNSVGYPRVRTAIFSMLRCSD